MATRLVRQEGPDTLVFPEGGGCISAFGVPFLAAGVFLTLVAARVLPLSNAEEVPPWAWPVMFIIGLVFVPVGGWLVFGRRWTALDLTRGLAYRRWGLLVPMREEEHPLVGYDAVLLRFEEGDSETADRYRVALRAQGGGADVPLCVSTVWQDSHEAATVAARFLGFPLVDASTDHVSVTEAVGAGATLPVRMRARHGLVEQVNRPSDLRSSVQAAGDAVQIAIPGPRFSRSALLGLTPAVLLVWLIPAASRFFERTGTPPFVAHAFLGFAVLLFVVAPAVGVVRAIVVAARARTLVSASPQGLVIEERGAWSSRLTRIRAEDVFDLDYGTAADVRRSGWRAAERQMETTTGRGLSEPDRRRAGRWLRALERLATSRGITVKSRRGLFVVGAGLPDEELRYLHAILCRAIAGGDSPS